VVAFVDIMLHGSARRSQAGERARRLAADFFASGPPTTRGIFTNYYSQQDARFTASRFLSSIADETFAVEGGCQAIQRRTRSGRLLFYVASSG
jgi:hypothetical protein